MAQKFFKVLILIVLFAITFIIGMFIGGLFTIK